jgi:hypothetical protein
LLALSGIMLSIGSARGDFWSIKLSLAGFEPRLRLKAQPIETEEPVHKILLEFPAIHYLPLFLKILLLDTKTKQSFIATLVMHYLYIIYSTGLG